MKGDHLTMPDPELPPPEFQMGGPSGGLGGGLLGTLGDSIRKAVEEQAIDERARFNLAVFIGMETIDPAEDGAEILSGVAALCERAILMQDTLDANAVVRILELVNSRETVVEDRPEISMENFSTVLKILASIESTLAAAWHHREEIIATEQDAGLVKVTQAVVAWIDRTGYRPRLCECQQVERGRRIARRHAAEARARGIAEGRIVHLGDPQRDN